MSDSNARGGAVVFVLVATTIVFPATLGNENIIFDYFLSAFVVYKILRGYNKIKMI